MKGKPGRPPVGKSRGEGTETKIIVQTRGVGREGAARFYIVPSVYPTDGVDIPRRCLTGTAVLGCGSINEIAFVTANTGE